MAVTQIVLNTFQLYNQQEETAFTLKKCYQKMMPQWKNLQKGIKSKVFTKIYLHSLIQTISNANLNERKMVKKKRKIQS